LSALERALNHSKSIGIDECEIVVLKKKIITVRITDSEIVETKENFDKSYGIRLIHDKKIASIQTTNQHKIKDAITDEFKRQGISKCLHNKVKSYKVYKVFINPDSNFDISTAKLYNFLNSLLLI